MQHEMEDLIEESQNCGVEDRYLDRLAFRPQPILWLNLDAEVAKGCSMLLNERLSRMQPNGYRGTE